MTILGIETSCDETSVGIIQYNERTQLITLIANIVASSLTLHAKTGGIIPETAAREQIKYIIPVIEEALKSGVGFDLKKDRKAPAEIDAIAVTYGPGLIGSLLVGVETARTLSYLWDIPLIPVNHMIGHIYANFISENSKLPKILTVSGPKGKTQNSKIFFPAIALVVSGGHTDLLLMKSHTDIKLLGGSRDDAAGEAFDKIGRLLGLPYPAGPIIEKLAKKGDPKRFRFPRPMIGSKDFDFSFSGLKTAVYREVQLLRCHPERPASPAGRSEGSRFARDSSPAAQNDIRIPEQTINDICYAVQDAIVDVIVKKTIKAAKKYNAKSILLSGGVAANKHLYNEFIHNTKYLIHDTVLLVPPKELCTDNGAMIATAAAFNFKPAEWNRVVADPELYY